MNVSCISDKHVVHLKFKIAIHRQRKEEVQAIYGPNEFTEFYSRLKGLKDFHRKHPNEV